jgi:hypothetical protein
MHEFLALVYEALLQMMIRNAIRKKVNNKTEHQDDDYFGK